MAWGLLAGVCAARPVGANCVADISPIPGEAAQAIFFPNWLKAYAAAFNIAEYGITCGAGCAGAANCAGGTGLCGGTGLQMNGLTIQNFGTAVAGTDIAAVYWRTDADAAGFYHTMTAIAPDTWTWAWNGAEANPNFAALPSLRIYADIAASPTEGRTIQLGVPYDPGFNVGGLTDTCCCNATFADVSNPMPKSIYYVFKQADLISAAPGDTINYTLYYGRPGAGSITNLEIIDTVPPYTHYVPGSSSGIPAATPDPGYDPDWGPPIRLKWTFPGPLATTGGPTGMITFKLTVDWGNGESFEPGSGDVAAPEGFNLWNQATGVFPNLAPGSQNHASNQTRTTVTRYLFWKTGDRDILYTCTPIACEEITYSIFIKNLSATKTWWKVSIWDSVPAQLDPWMTGYGFDDPCLGWTMTPGGCAAATPGRVIAGAQTILTWTLDMPPAMTLELRWKASMRPSITAGATTINKVSIMEQGRSNVVNGTGHAGAPRNFTHLANVILRTTYVSYVAYDYTSCFDAGNNYYFITFYPLHPSTAFQLFYLQGACGLNASITTSALALPCSTWPGPGCNIGIERQPQIYGGNTGYLICNNPRNDYYKLVANSPVLWEVMPDSDETNQDSVMYAPTTSITFCGYTVYTYRRQQLANGNATEGDYLGLVNTENTATTVHLFTWNGASLAWDYQESRTIDPLSQWSTGGTSPTDEGHWRVLSSDSKLICWQGDAYEGMTDYDNFTTMAPATSGNLVAKSPDIFYAYTGRRGAGFVITNIGAVNAKYELWQYQSSERTLTVGFVPPLLGGASGTWVPVDANTVPFGQAAASPYNPQSYSTNACDNTKVDFSETFELLQVRVLAGTIQVRTGRGASSRYGGYVLHGLDGPGGNPSQSVNEFWHTQHLGDSSNDLVAFCPAKGMVVQMTSEDGFSATYTSTGPDQPMAFCGISELAGSCGTNYRGRVLAPVGGRVIAQQNATYFTERGYTAPFLSTGVHYDIIAPTTVFAGQSFWITVVVLNQGGGTKTDYCGTTTFTSTDPLAKLEGVGMATYDFTWSSATACNTAPNEDGVKLFFNVTLSRLGLQTIVGSDTADGSITGLTAVMVVGADVKLTKEPRLTVGASGDIVSFRVCWSNYSSASAFTFVITDAVPRGTTFLPEAGTAAFDCGNTDGLPPVTAYSTATSVTPPAAFTTGNPTAGTFWLRWTIPMSGVGTTGCVCYRVTVN